MVLPSFAEKVTGACRQQVPALLKDCRSPIPDLADANQELILELTALRRSLDGLAAGSRRALALQFLFS